MLNVGEDRMKADVQTARGWPALTERAIPGA